MSYLRVELTALEKAHSVAPVLGIPHQQVSGGLNELWAYCWREKTDRVRPIQLEGLFACSSTRLGEALVAFGFLEEAGDEYRVRGTGTYLKLAEANAENGRKRAAGATRKSGRFTSKPPATHQRPTSDPPATHQPPPALTSNIQHPTSNKDSKDSSPAVAGDVADAPASPPEPKPQELVFAAWRQELGKPDAPMGHDDFAIIGARLKEGFTVEQLRQVPRGARVDSERWPERRAQDEIRFLFGSAGQVRKFMDLAAKGNPRQAKREDFRRLLPVDNSPERKAGYGKL